MLYSEDDAISRPSDRLIDLALAAAAEARHVDLSDIIARMAGRFTYPDSSLNVWPGEHYRLLAGLALALKPRQVVEIGTAEGLSALTFLKYLPADARVATFDIVAWDRYPHSCLQASDFGDGRLTQILADLQDPATFAQHHALLAGADLMFIDAPKDGKFEPRIVQLLNTLRVDVPPIVVFDDIRHWNMLALWRGLRWPKMDVTSFGHWSGTGLCELQPARRA